MSARFIGFVFVLAVQLLAIIPIVNATTVVQLSDSQLVNSSDIIALGTVSSTSTSRGAGGLVTTSAVLQIEQLLSGNTSSSSVTVIRYGGSFEGQQYHMAGNATLSQGERVVVFLNKASAEEYAIVGLAQGKYLVQGVSEDGDLVLSRDLGELNFYERSNGTTATGTQEKTTLSEIVEKIASVKE